MAIVKKKVTTKPATNTKKVSEPVSAIITSLDSKIADTVSVKIKRGGAYGAWGIELLHTMQVPEGATPEETLESIMDSLTAKADQYIEAKGFNALTDADIDSTVTEEAEEEVEEEAEAEVTEAQVRMMDRKSLIALLEGYETDIDPDDYKKLAAFRDIVAETLFPSEEAEDEVEEEAEAEEGEELTEEVVRAMSREELIELIKDNDLDIDPKKYKKTPALIEVVIGEVFPDEDEVEGETDDAEEGEEGEELTEEAVREMDRESLIELIKEYDLQIDPKKYKKTPALVEVVVEGLFTEEEGDDSEFDDTEFDDE